LVQVTPVGRIISRFAKDISAVDERLGMMFNSVIGMFIMMGQTLMVIAGITGWAFMLGITPIMYLYYSIQRTYKIAALQYKRMESVTRSPIYNHTGETLSGISTIRAYDTADKAEQKNADVTNINSKAMFIMRTVERWLDLRLQSIGNAVVLVAGLMGVASKGTGVYSGLIGIALVYGMRITQMLSWAVRSSTELAINMNSVERILHYTDNPDPEEPRGKQLIVPPASWPSAGKVQFSKLCMRYRPGLELVLHDLDFIVEGGEKVGIVGRTGAGKSSLMLALFRMIEPASGAITIDGIDISKISLHNLRARMSIIPQDPVLFSGDVS
jgi:ABC-type multidrug transport system fused ATPase/permease subunit